MASDRIDWVLLQVDTWNSGDFEGFLAAVGPEFEFSPDPSFPDAGTYRGEELRRWMRDWVKTWRENRLEVLAISEERGAVIADARWHLVAPQTGGEIPIEDFTMVFWFDPEGKPGRMAAFFDRQRALDAVDA
ncbi:MAG: nuclear transport factor 2 family protein [Solirubrobacterales bacterium]